MSYKLTTLTSQQVERIEHLYWYTNKSSKQSIEQILDILNIGYIVGQNSILNISQNNRID